jgi:hypothetical protein
MRDLIKKILREEIVKNKVVCDGCGWSWKLSDGGEDKYVCHKCGNDNAPKKSNIDNILEKYKSNFPDEFKHTVDIIGDYIKKYIKKNKFNVKLLNSCSTSFNGVRTKDQIIICSPNNFSNIGNFIYVIFHEIRHEQQISKILMNNPLTGDLEDFEKLYDEYWEMELDADQFAKNMIVKLVSKLNLPEEIVSSQFKLSPYISQYPSLSNSVKMQLQMIVNQIKDLKKSGVDYEDIQDHPMVKVHLDKLEDLI